MSRKQAPLTTTIHDRDELIAACTQALVDGAGEYYEGIHDTKRWLAVAIADRNFQWLQDLALGYRERDKQVFGDLTGLRLPKNNRKQTYRLIREWCGLSEAWQANEEAGRELIVAEDSAREKHRKLNKHAGNQYFDSIVVEVDRILSEGFTVIGDRPEGRVLFRPGDETKYYVLRFKARGKRAAFHDAVPYVEARIKALNASAAYKAEVDRNLRVMASKPSPRNPGVISNSAIFFL